MKSPDPASLQNLNDIVLPPTVGWWPLAGGWYLVFLVLLFVFVWFSYRWLKQWMNNRYRRTALSELQLLENCLHDPEKRDVNLRQLPILLKRTALSVYPRSQVASLSGNDWFNFLNSTGGKPLFTKSAASTLDKISYSVGSLSQVDSQATTALFNASKFWLKHHQIDARSMDDREI